MTFPNELGQYRDGLYRRRVEKVTSTASRIYSSKTEGPLTVEESGTYFYVPALTAAVHTLPKISSKWLGVEYTYFVAVQDAGTFKINCALDSSASIKLPFSSIVDEHSSIATDSSFATGITLTAVSSIVWMGQPIMVNSYHATTKISTTVKRKLSGWTTA